ncbi:MAG: renalase [Verrucomicrobiales bacterium]|jgi:renalase
MRKRLAIIGAGPAGLAAAWELRQADFDVVVFEKSRGLCGRAASRTRHGVRIDPGANFIKTGSPEIERLLRQQLPADDLAEIVGDVWTHTADHELHPGDPNLNREAKWTYRSGISTLGKLLAAASGAEIIRETRIGRLDRKKDGWEVFDSAGDSRGVFDRLLLTPPAPQTIELLEASGLSSQTWASSLIKGLRPAEFHRQFCFAFGFEGDLERPGDFHASLNPDGRHPIAWLSFENDKPGHVPHGLTVVVCQMQPSWSATHFEDHTAGLAEIARRDLTRLLRWPDAKPEWFDAQRWKFAHPVAAADSALTRAGESHGLFIAGDALIGKGRVNRALETGLAAARRIAAS